MQWSLGLAAWIIQDGNYGDFRRGDQIEVAVEFVFEELSARGQEAPRASLVTDCTYEVSGRVVAVTQDAWVIDIGVLVFQESKPPKETRVGDVVSGRAYLGVDPFFYFERLSKSEALPPMIYTWRVLQVLQQTAPFLEREGVRYRDATQLGWREIEATNAWADDDGNAEYVLRCELLPVPPKRSSATAG